MERDQRPLRNIYLQKFSETERSHFPIYLNFIPDLSFEEPGVSAPGVVFARFAAVGHLMLIYLVPARTAFPSSN